MSLNSTSITSKEIKLLLVGDGEVGKTVFVKRHKTGEFERQYISSPDRVSNLHFHTSAGEVIFNIWELNDLNDLSEEYSDADAAIIMFDVTSECSYKSAPEYYKKITSICSKIPIVLCGNKVDCRDRKVKLVDINFHRDVNISYYGTSSKSNSKFGKPFLTIIKELLKDDTIHYIEAPAIFPPESTAEEIVLDNDAR